MSLSQYRILSIVIPVLVLSVSCRSVRRTLGDREIGANGSVVASIEGLSEDERKALKNPKYLLLCGAAEKVEGKVDNQDNPNAIHFDFTTPLSAEAKQSCGLQIWADAPSQADLAQYDFKWFAYPAVPETNPTRLFYASSRDAVAGGSLKVTLYKLYSKVAKNEPMFLQPLLVKFPESDPMPQEALVSANLICDGTDIATTSGMVKSLDAAKKTEAAITFALPISKYKGKSCSKILVAVAGEVKYEASLTAAVLDAAPAPGSTGKPIGPVDLIKATGGNIIVNPSNGGDCLYFDVVLSKCVDRLTFELPRAQNFWLALVSGKDASGGKVEVLVSGPNGLGIDGLAEHKILSRDALNADIAAGAAAAKFSYYQASAKTEILAALFDQNVTGPAALSAKRKAPGELRAIKLLSIDEVYIHGFSKVGEDALNGKPAARWLAMVKATKAAATAEFIVTGGADYFWSDMRRGGTAEKPAYFDWNAVKVDRDTAGKVGETDHYDVYSFTGGAAVPTGCATPREYYLDDMSGKTMADFPVVVPANGGADPKLEACEVRTFGKDFDDYTIEVSLYEWAWHKLTP